MSADSPDVKEALDYGSDFNPRKAEEIRCSITGEEYDALINCMDAFGIDTETLHTLTNKVQLGHNSAFEQFLRLVIQGEVNATELDPEPVPEENPKIPAGATRAAKIEVAVTPEESERVEYSMTKQQLLEANTSRNHGKAAKLRAGVIRPFLDLAYGEE